MDIRSFASVVVQRDSRILCVVEGRSDNFGLLNLPGGHLEHGEKLADCARREAREEAGLEVELTGLLGVYTGLLDSGVHAVRFVFLADAGGSEPIAGDDIDDVVWRSVSELRSLEAEELVSSAMFRRILEDVRSGVSWPLDVLAE